METEAEISAGPSVEQVEEGMDGKSERKRKFKPFEAMRKFFRASRKRSKVKEGDSIVCVKAKSTSELVSQQIEEEEEDEGGFKTHKKLSQARSISEDSIFNPDPKDSKKANIETFKKGAKSVENINQNFKSELATKLKKRQSFHSDDDGLPKSPVSSFTTADVIMGGLKGTPGKSASRDSDKSLLSVGSSDNEEDDLFQTNWKASVASVVTRRSQEEQNTETSMDCDLSVVLPTTALRCDAAKHRISVAPKARRGARQGKKTQLKSNATALPKLTEESPAKISKEEDVFQMELSPPASKDAAVKPPLKKTSSLEKPASEKIVDVSRSKSPDPKPAVISAKPTLTQKLSGEKSEEIVSKSSAPCASSPPPAKVVLEDVKMADKPEEKEKDTSSGVTELSQALNRLRKTSVKKTEDSHDSDKENLNEESSPQKVTETEKNKTPGKLPAQGSAKTVNAPEKVNELSVSKTTGVKEVSSAKAKEPSVVPDDDKVVVKSPLRPTLSSQSDSSSKDDSSAGVKPDSSKNESSSPNTAKLAGPELRSETSSAPPGGANVRVSVGAGFRASLKSSDAKTVPVGTGTKSSLSTDAKSASSSGVKSSVSVGAAVTTEAVNAVKAPGVTGGGATSGASEAVTLEGTTAAAADKSVTASGAKSSATSKTAADSSSPGVHRLASPKEEYKQKRQGRSKTLPEQPLAAEVVRHSAHTQRNDYDNVTITTKRPQVEDKSKSVGEKPSTTQGGEEAKKDGEKTGSSPPASPARQPNTVITTAAKRPEPKRLSLKSGLVSDSSEPVWVVMARKKNAQESAKDDKDNSGSSKSTDGADATKTAPVPASAASTTSSSTKPVMQNSPPKHVTPASPSKTPFKETKMNTKVSPPPEVKSVSKPILIENKPPGKTESEEKTSISVSTDSRSVLVNRPPVKFVRNLPPSKPAQTTPPPATVSKPSLGKSFVVDKPAQVMTKPAANISKPSAETWKVSASKTEANSSAAKPTGPSFSSAQKSFTIDKSSLGHTVPSMTGSTSSNSTKTEKPEKKEETKPSNVPAWRSNLQKKKDPVEVKVPEMKKIEIIEKTSPITSQKPTQSKSPEKPADESPVILREKAKADKCSDVASARSSKVLDMVKNFQKLQVS